MPILIGTLFVVGWLALLIGGIMLIVAAFRVSVVWGLCVLFLGPAGLVFLIMHWEEAKRAFGVQMLGLVIAFGGIGLGMSQGAGAMDPLLRKMAESGLAEEHFAALQKMAPELLVPEGDEPVAPEAGQPVMINGQDPKSLQGATLAEVREALGRPKGELKSSEEVCLLYDGFTVFSADGNIVSHVEVEGEVPTGERNKQPTARSTSNGSDNSQPAVRMISNGGQRVDMKDVIVPGKITVVDFYADWCGPCKRMGPQLEQIARTDPDIRLCKIDVVNWETDVVKQYKIRSIPNVRVYDRNGIEVGSGSSSLTMIRQNIERAR